MKKDPRITRREFIRWGGLSIAAVTVGGSVTALNPFEAGAETALPDLAWDKAPCRFCGTGCGVLVGVKNGRVMAVQGDPESSVNQGTLCVKGFALPFIQYGADRLTTPLIRKKNGRYDKKGALVEASWDEAMGLVASKAKEAMAAGGPKAVALFGSGQWTIWEGYAASKLWKGGLRSNSIEVNARHCMASAVTGFMTSFGMDEPMGTYEDFKSADVFVLWGANMAEMHPILFSKITDRLLSAPLAKLYNLTTMSNLSSAMAAKEILFKPQSDLAIANGIANLLFQNGWVDRKFVERHCVVKRGKENIGYGLEDGFKFKDEPVLADIEAYRQYVAAYTPSHVEKLSGVEEEVLLELAKAYGTPGKKVMSLWTMGMNQHTRGTWINNLVNNLHLLTGKISEPGNQPYSLTGQPSACGTCREVGTFTHRLPAAMWVEKEGSFGNAERRTHFWKRMVDPPGSAKSDLWQLLEFAKLMGHAGLFERPAADFPVPAGHKASDAAQAWGFYMEKALWEEYRKFGLGHGHDLAPFEAYHSSRGLRWPVADGKETLIRYREGFDPYVPKGAGVSFYGYKATGGKAVIWMRPYEAPPEVPDKDFPLWLCTGRVLEHWHSGTMSRRVPSLFKAYPHATASFHHEDAERLKIKPGDKIRVSSRRGAVELFAEVGGRVTPQEGMVYVPWFDEDVLINLVTLDAYCPISGQADFKKCAVRIERLS